jgi:hypothetical protein
VLKSILIVEQTINTWGVTLGLDTCRYWTPAWVLFKARVFPILGPWDPIAGGPDPIRGGGGGSGTHSRGPAYTRGGPGPTLEVRTVYPGV